MSASSATGSCAGIPYGCEHLGRLESVLLHTPGEELQVINESNYQHWLFDSVPDIRRFRQEHEQYRALLQSLGVRTFVLADYVEKKRTQMRQMPNLTYLHDVAVITSRGAVLSRMAWAGRREEESVLQEALERLGIPTWIQFTDPEDAFEGCLLLSPDSILVAETERHKSSSILKFIRMASPTCREIIYAIIPKQRRFMHADTVFNRVSEKLAMAYLPAFQQVYRVRKGILVQADIRDIFNERGIEIIGVSDEEQKRLACSFVPLQSGVIIHYDQALSRETRRKLERKGVEFIFFHPDAILAGGGSLRCLTLRLHRAVPHFSDEAGFRGGSRPT